MTNVEKYNLYKKLKDAYGNTTHNYNEFERAILSVNWENQFNADGEMYFCIDDCILTVENINPFKEQWSPAFSIMSEGSVLSF
jgi:hypothetical protein